MLTTKMVEALKIYIILNHKLPVSSCIPPHNKRIDIKSDPRILPTNLFTLKFYHVLNGGDPGGAFIITSTSGITYPKEITAIINTTHRLQRSVHLGVGVASSSSSAIGNAVSPLGALSIK